MNKKIVMLITVMIVFIVFAIVFAAEQKKVETQSNVQRQQEKMQIEQEKETPMNAMQSGEIVEEISGEKVENVAGNPLTVIEALEVQKEKTQETHVAASPKTSSTTKTTKSLTSNTPYYIKINNLQNVVNIYQKDAEGNYTIPYKAMLCSIGEATPKAGKMYKVTTYKMRWNGLQGNVYGQYATQIVGNILFHSVPYTAKTNSSLEYWEYDKLGTAASLGCVRLTVEDAKWIYDNISAGTIVEFYEDENPGPFGKPVAQKITDNEFCRNWDPTDWVEGNPWKLPEVVQQHDVSTIVEQEIEKWEQENESTEDILTEELEVTENRKEENTNSESAVFDNQMPEWLR